jgi:hypothetical protein
MNKIKLSDTSQILIIIPVIFLTLFFLKRWDIFKSWLFDIFKMFV